VQERTKGIVEVARPNLRTAQDRLIQTEKLASPANSYHRRHRARDQKPAHFVNKFSALSVELSTNWVRFSGPRRWTTRTRRETDELAQMLKSNLEKRSARQTRADLIVKNMLAAFPREFRRASAGQSQRPCRIVP